ncbi:MAG: FixH family protein [Acidobacteria bacterium]|nr:FixH family protein [Acidobacteriota bacterium]
MDTKPEETKPKSLWGYGIAAVYTVFALSTLGIVAFTMTQKIELVSPDYYAKEVKYEQQINRQRQTNALEQPVTCVLSEDGQSVKLQFPAQSANVQGTILFYRPSDSARDQEFAIALSADSSQTIPTAKLAKGLWRVKVTWSSDGRDFYNEFIVMV